MRKLATVHDPNPPHWVGDGFPVRSIFSYDGLGRERLSPFLMLDYAAPRSFEPATHRRGVGEHPHRGFETVTIVYQGELEHRDSAGIRATKFHHSRISSPKGVPPINSIRETAGDAISSDARPVPR